MINLLTEYLKKTFPESDLSIPFGEVHCDVDFVIGASCASDGYALFIPDLSHLAIEIFDYYFSSEEEPIWVLVNEWGADRLKYVSDQFSNLSQDSTTWYTRDTCSDVFMKQIFLIKNKKEINYKNLFKALVTSNDASVTHVDDRIYFINPLTNVVFKFWDEAIILGSNSPYLLEPIYYKYRDYINEHCRQNFERHLPMIRFIITPPCIVKNMPHIKESKS